MKYYIIAGEASGDLHGAALIKALKKRDAAAEIRMWGGDQMKAAGGTLVKHYKDLAFMGFSEVLMNIGTILKNFRFCKSDIRAFNPDKIIYIDYPGFNLRMARWAKKMGFTNIYYISPQIWAWHSSRVHQIKRDIDKMFVILPFEKSFYKKYGMEVDFVGHPLMDAIKHHTPDPNFSKNNQILADKPLIAVLPGSRKQEISRLLPEMIEVMKKTPQFQFAIACAPSQDIALYQHLLNKGGLTAGVSLINNQTYSLLSVAKAALVTSGTATLETALFGVPQVVCYKGSPLSYLIARKVINVPFISLVNLIAGEKIVEELIQGQCNADNMRIALLQLFDSAHRSELLAGYEKITALLAGDGAGAADKVAAGIHT